MGRSEVVIEEKQRERGMKNDEREMVKVVRNRRSE